MYHYVATSTKPCPAHDGRTAAGLRVTVPCIKFLIRRYDKNCAPDQTFSRVVQRGRAHGFPRVKDKHRNSFILMSIIQDDLETKQGPCNLQKFCGTMNLWERTLRYKDQVYLLSRGNWRRMRACFRFCRCLGEGVYSASVNFSDFSVSACAAFREPISIW